MRRKMRAKSKAGASRQSVLPTRLDAIAAELRAVNAAQARAALKRLRASLLDQRAKGITGDAGEASPSQSPEDVV